MENVRLYDAFKEEGERETKLKKAVTEEGSNITRLNDAVKEEGEGVTRLNDAFKEEGAGVLRGPVISRICGSPWTAYVSPLPYGMYIPYTRMECTYTTRIGTRTRFGSWNLQAWTH